MQLITEMAWPSFDKSFQMLTAASDYLQSDEDHTPLTTDIFKYVRFWAFMIFYKYYSKVNVNSSFLTSAQGSETNGKRVHRASCDSVMTSMLTRSNVSVFFNPSDDISIW